jgi:hypothetical protein
MEPSPKRSYSFNEVTYRNGQSERFPPEYRFKTDVAGGLWVCDSKGPLYLRALKSVAGIAAVEVAV